MRKTALFLILFCISGLRADKAAEYYGQFVQAYHNGDKAAAAKYIEKAYQANPSNNNILQWYGNILNQNKKYADAIRVWKQISPDYFPSAVNKSIAEAYHQLGDHQSAEKYYTMALTNPAANPQEKVNIIAGLMAAVYNDMPDNPKVLALEKKFAEAECAAPELKTSWARYMFCKYFLDRAVEFAGDGYENDGFAYYRLAMKYFGPELEKYTNYIAPEFFGYEWMKREKYALALSVFEEVFPLRNDNYLTWAYSEMLRQTGKPAEAIGVCVKGLKKPGGDDKMYGWIYRQIIDVAGQSGDLSALAAHENDADAYLVKNNPEMGDWVRFRITEIYFNEGLKAMAEKPYPNGVELLKKAMVWNNKGLGKYKDSFNNKTIEVIIEASKYWNGEGKKLATSAAPYRFTIIAMESFNGVIIDEGKKTPANFSLSPEMERTIPAAFEVFRQLYFYMTGGKMLAGMKYVRLTNILTEVQVSYWKPAGEASVKPGKGITMYAAIWGSIKPSPIQTISNEMKYADTLVMIFPFFCTAGSSSVVYYQDAAVPKGYTAHGLIQIPKDYTPFSYGLFAHEFFHTVEYFYGDKYQFVQHGYKEEYRKSWPSWYHGEGELYYYYSYLREITGKYGIAPLLRK
jgi:tetratricopeptide (TPR) repeat protein